jgi:hypothetical protein
MRGVDIFVGALVTLEKESFPGRQVYSVEEVAHKKQIARLGKIADGEKYDVGWAPFSCLEPANYDEARSWAEAIRHREKDGNPPESQPEKKNKICEGMQISIPLVWQQTKREVRAEVLKITANGNARLEISNLYNPVRNVGFSLGWYPVEDLENGNHTEILHKIHQRLRYDSIFGEYVSSLPAVEDEPEEERYSAWKPLPEIYPPMIQADSPPTDDPDTTTTEELVERARNHKTLTDFPGIEMIKKQIEEELGKLRRKLLDAAVEDSGPCYAERIVFAAMFTVLSGVDVTNCEKQFPALENYCKKLVNADDRKIIWNCIDRIKRLLLVWDRVNAWLDEEED